MSKLILYLQGTSAGQESFVGMRNPIQENMVIYSLFDLVR